MSFYPKRFSLAVVVALALLPGRCAMAQEAQEPVDNVAVSSDAEGAAPSKLLPRCPITTGTSESLRICVCGRTWHSRL